MSNKYWKYYGCSLCPCHKPFRIDNRNSHCKFHGCNNCQNDHYQLTVTDDQLLIAGGQPSSSSTTQGLHNDNNFSSTVNNDGNTAAGSSGTMFGPTMMAQSQNEDGRSDFRVGSRTCACDPLANNDKTGPSIFDGKMGPPSFSDKSGLGDGTTFSEKVDIEMEHKNLSFTVNINNSQSNISGTTQNDSIRTFEPPKKTKYQQELENKIAFLESKVNELSQGTERSKSGFTLSDLASGVGSANKMAQDDLHKQCQETVAAKDQLIASLLADKQSLQYQLVQKDKIIEQKDSTIQAMLDSIIKIQSYDEFNKLKSNGLGFISSATTVQENLSQGVGSPLIETEEEDERMENENNIEQIKGSYDCGTCGAHCVDFMDKLRHQQVCSKLHEITKNLYLTVSKYKDSSIQKELDEYPSMANAVECAIFWATHQHLLSAFNKVMKKTEVDIINSLVEEWKYINFNDIDADISQCFNDRMKILLKAKADTLNNYIPELPIVNTATGRFITSQMPEHGADKGSFCNTDPVLEFSTNTKMQLDNLKRQVNNNGPVLSQYDINKIQKEKEKNDKKFRIVPLKNLGSTCYMNSVLQMMYHINWYLIQKPLFTYQADPWLIYLIFFEKEHILINQQQDASQYLSHLSDKNTQAIQNILSHITTTTHRESTCITCDNIIHSFTTNTHQLILNMKDEDTKSYFDLQKALGVYFTPHYIQDYSCEHCEKPVLAKSLVKLDSTSDMLILTLSRFKADLTKDCTTIQVPDTLKLNEQSFSLVGYIVHCGKSLNAGHYKYYIKNGKTTIVVDEILIDPPVSKKQKINRNQERKAVYVQQQHKAPLRKREKKQTLKQSVEQKQSSKLSNLKMIEQFLSEISTELTSIEDIYKSVGQLHCNDKFEIICRVFCDGITVNDLVFATKKELQSFLALRNIFIHEPQSSWTTKFDKTLRTEGAKEAKYFLRLTDENAVITDVFMINLGNAMNDLRAEAYRVRTEGKHLTEQNLKVINKQVKRIRITKFDSTVDFRGAIYSSERIKLMNDLVKLLNFGRHKYKSMSSCFQFTPLSSFISKIIVGIDERHKLYWKDGHLLSSVSQNKKVSIGIRPILNSIVFRKKLAQCNDTCMSRSEHSAGFSSVGQEQQFFSYPNITQLLEEYHTDIIDTINNSELLGRMNCKISRNQLWKLFFEGTKCDVAVKAGNIGAVLYAHKKEGNKFVGMLDVCQLSTKSLIAKYGLSQKYSTYDLLDEENYIKGTGIRESNQHQVPCLPFKFGVDLESLKEIGVDVESFGLKSVITTDTIKLVNTSTTTVFKNAQDEQQYSLKLVEQIEQRYTNSRGTKIENIVLQEYTAINGITFSTGLLRLYDDSTRTFYSDTYTSTEYNELSKLLQKQSDHRIYGGMYIFIKPLSAVVVQSLLAQVHNNYINLLQMLDREHQMKVENEREIKKQKRSASQKKQQQNKEQDILQNFVNQNTVYQFNINQDTVQQDMKNLYLATDNEDANMDQSAEEIQLLFKNSNKQKKRQRSRSPSPQRKTGIPEGFVANGCNKNGSQRIKCKRCKKFSATLGEDDSKWKDHVC